MNRQLHISGLHCICINVVTVANICTGTAVGWNFHLNTNTSENGIHYWVFVTIMILDPKLNVRCQEIIAVYYSVFTYSSNVNSVKFSQYNQFIYIALWLLLFFGSVLSFIDGKLPINYFLFSIQKLSIISHCLRWLVIAPM